MIPLHAESDLFMKQAHYSHVDDASPNKPAAPNARIASGLAIEHHWPGVGEPERWAKCNGYTPAYSVAAVLVCENLDTADMGLGFVVRVAGGGDTHGNYDQLDRLSSLVCSRGCARSDCRGLFCRG